MKSLTNLMKKITNIDKKIDIRNEILEVKIDKVNTGLETKIDTLNNGIEERIETAVSTKFKFSIYGIIKWLTSGVIFALVVKAGLTILLPLLI